MSEFVNLIDSSQDESTLSNPFLISKTVISVEPETLPSIDYTEISCEENNEEDVYIKECDNACSYGCNDENGNFKVENLFSELTTEYQRALARGNLGIGDEYSMLWGKIGGNIANQKDLIIVLANKAPLLSPKFLGTPIVPMPAYDDNSSRIASTAWVKDQLKNFSGGSTGPILPNNLISISSSPQFAFFGEGPIDIRIAWDYNNPVSYQEINGVSIEVNLRSKTFIGVNNSTIYKLKYTYQNVSYSTELDFKFYYPRYYGIGNDVSNLNKTKSNSFYIDCGETNYAKIIIDRIDARFSVNGFIGGFKMIGTMNLHNTTYYVYESSNPGLGEINVELL